MEEIKKKINELTEVSEEIKKLCEEIIVNSQREIAGFHSGEDIDFSKMKEGINKLKEKIKDPLVYAINRNLTFKAYQEYAEAEFTWAIVKGKELPSLDIPEPCYFTGLCDAIGEVRRQFMIALINDEKDKAERLMDRVLKLGSEIAEVDASPAVVRSLKHKKDLVSRSIEKMLELSARNK